MPSTITKIVISLLVIVPMKTYAFKSVSAFDENKSDYKALVFLSKDCPCSKSHVAHLNQLDDKYKEVSFFGVMTDVINKKNKTSVLNYYNSKNFEFPIIENKSQSLIKKYKALKTPHVTLLKKNTDGNYETIYQGGVTDRRDFAASKKMYLNENLAAISEGRDLVHQTGRSLGCYIRKL